MTENKLMVGLATILTALAEGSGESREGIMYAALCGTYSLDEFHGLLRMLSAFGASGTLIERGPDFLVKITDAGRKLADKINAAIAP